MKTSALPEIEALRAEVHYLRESIAELEYRLADFEDDDDSWAIWPYCYFVSAWNAARKCFHSFHKRGGNWALRRYNRRLQRAAQGQNLGEMRLT